MEASTILDLVTEASKLKTLPRTGWVRKGVDDPETVAEHSWRAAVLAMFLAREEGLDVEKCVTMLLFHDLPEIIIGDLTPDDPDYDDKEGRERVAVESLYKDFPRVKALWEEFTAQETPEAKLALQCDKLEMLIQAKEYEDRGHDLWDFWDDDYGFEGRAGEIDKLLRSRRG